MPTIRLERGEWEFDEAQNLGPPGGFGDVFRGEGVFGPAAIKRLRLSAGAAAHREMTIGETLAAGRFQHVVPVLDYGRDAQSDSYYLVMPICDGSLQELLERDGAVPWANAKQIILDIISGLQEVGNIVHRDLKPGNVLQLDGRWQIADFGIAKFVEDATSLQTLRECLTPAYAAPEQWRGERPTGETDVYALGCIIYALLTGEPPFRGDLDDVRKGHLSSVPSPISGADARLNSLLSLMLRKAQLARPKLDRCRSLISAISDTLPAAGPRASLAAAGQAVAAATAVAEAERIAAATAASDFRAVGQEGAGEFGRLLDALCTAIIADAPNASKSARAIQLGQAHLSWDAPALLDGKIQHPPEPTKGSWVVACYSGLHLRCELTNKSYYEPSIYIFNVTLVFASTPTDSEFRWREVAFYRQFSGDMSNEPTAIPPTQHYFYEAQSPTMSSYAVAHGPIAVDAEDEGNFIDRWISLFAKATEGKLRPPQGLPLGPQFFG